MFAMVFLIAVFSVSAAAKLWDRTSFRRTLQDLQLPPILVNLGVFAVPAGELLFALLLLPNKTRMTGLLGLGAMLLIFSYAAWRASRLHQQISCNCFGNLVPETFGWHTAVKIVLLGIAVAYAIGWPMDYAHLWEIPLLELAAAGLISFALLLMYALWLVMKEKQV